MSISEKDLDYIAKFYKRTMLSKSFKNNKEDKEHTDMLIFSYLHGYAPKMAIEDAFKIRDKIYELVAEE